MRFLSGSKMAMVLAVGSATIGATSAFAGDDIFFNHAAGTMSGSVATDSPAVARTQPYMKMDPRDAKAIARQDVDASNVYYNHAEGTMSGPAVDTAQTSADPNGNYVASYHQYMQMDPRDAKPAARESAPDNNIFFNHAEGTMSGN